MKLIIERNRIVLEYQFFFREQHSTNGKENTLMAVIEKVLEENEVCPTLFLKIAYTVDKVWHGGSVYK